MHIELTEQQQRQIAEAQGSEPVRVVNPATNEVFILVAAEVYERLDSILQIEFDPREAYPLVDRVMAEDDENDPCLATYQNIQRESRP